MSEQDFKLPALIDRAQHCLAGARTSAEVLEARAAAQAALHYAKLVRAANETQGDCIKMIARAEIRMAYEIDAAQERGEVAQPKDGSAIRDLPRTSGEVPATYRDLNLDDRRVAEWRQLRDAGGEALVEKVIQDALSEGRAPKASNIRNEVRNVTFITRSEPPKPSKPLVLEGQRFTEEVQQTALWWAVRHGILNEVNTEPDPVKAAVAVPADKKLWASDQVARQLAWLSQFIDALIEDVQKSLPEDCAPVEENARSR